jgi:hypothetical protein
LFRPRVEPILVGFIDTLPFHSTLFCPTDVRLEAGIASPAGDNARDPMPKVRGMRAFLLRVVIPGDAQLPGLATISCRMTPLLAYVPLEIRALLRVRTHDGLFLVRHPRDVIGSGIDLDHLKGEGTQWSRSKSRSSSVVPS